MSDGSKIEKLKSRDSVTVSGGESLPKVLIYKCKRCGVGVDSDGDGHCAVCAKMPDDVVSKFRAGMDRIDGESRGQQAKTGREVQLEDLVRHFIVATMNVGDSSVAACHARAKELGFL